MYINHLITGATWPMVQFFSRKFGRYLGELHSNDSLDALDCGGPLDARDLIPSGGAWRGYDGDAYDCVMRGE